MPGIGQCVICGTLCRKTLCRRHLKNYRFVKKYNFFALKPKRQVSNPQEQLFLNARAIYKQPTYQEVSFDFCNYSRFDIVVPDRKLILEYDGEQHFQYVEFFHKTLEGFKEYKEKEIFKEAVAKKNGYKVIRFSHVNDVADRAYVRKVLTLKNA